jgi:heat shock protein HtpX
MFKNTMKTAALLAGIGALFMAVGSLLGGSTGLVIGLVIGLVFVGGSYWFSDKLAVKSARAVEVSPQEAPELHAMVEDLAQRAGIPKPRVYMAPSEQPNAFATGRNERHAVVAVTQGLMQAMNRDEVYGVLAHEISHVRHRDILISSVAAGLASVVMYLGYLAWLFPIGRSSDDDGPGPLGALAVLILGPIAAGVIQMAISRSREYQADASGAQVTGDPLALASALRKLEMGTRQLPLPPEPNLQTTSALMIANPFRREGMTSWFSTHPPMAERIARLEQMAGYRR